MVSSNSLRPVAVLPFALVLLLLGWFQVDAAHAGPAPACLDFERAVEADDGSVVAVGPECLVKLDPEGARDGAFGKAGRADFATGDRILDLLLSDGRPIVVTDRGLTRFKPNGTIDNGFGGDGSVSTGDVPPMTDVSAATVGSNGGVYLAGKQMPGSWQSVARFTSSGELDPGFGTGGVYTADPSITFEITRLRQDGSGRLLVAGPRGGAWGTWTVSVARLLSGGALDSAFGDGGVTVHDLFPGQDPCTGFCDIRVHGIGIDANSNVTILGSWMQGYRVYNANALWAKFDQNGDPISNSTREMPSYGPTFELLPGGDLGMAYAGGARFHPDGTPGFENGKFAYAPGRTSPCGLFSNSISYNPVTGNLVSGGKLTDGQGIGEDASCDEPSPTNRAVVVKIDADTGRPARKFGSSGFAMPSPNACRFGTAGSASGPGPWQRCRLEPPKPTAKIRVHGLRTNRPWVTARLRFKELPSSGPRLDQRLKLTLADEIPIRDEYLKADSFRVKVLKQGLGTVKARPYGHDLTVRFAAANQKPEEVGVPLDVLVTIRPGAIEKLPRHIRKRGLGFEVTGIFDVGTSATGAWWAQSTANRLYRVRR